MGIKTKFPPICPVCGGRMVVEFFGNYGDVYKVNKNGTLSKTRKERHIYPVDFGYCEIYCSKCGLAWAGGKNDG